MVPGFSDIEDEAMGWEYGFDGNHLQQVLSGTSLSLLTMQSLHMAVEDRQHQTTSADVCSHWSVVGALYWRRPGLLCPRAAFFP